MKGFPNDEVMIMYLGAHLSEISEVMIFLLGAMTIVELINAHGGFNIILNLIKTHHKVLLLWIISFITFFTSSVLDNLTTAIVIVSLVRRILPDQNERLVFASMIIIAANAGGAWTPIGDVTTTMLWMGKRVTAGGLVYHLFIPSLISMAVPLIYFSLILKKEGAAQPAVLNPENVPAAYGAKRILFLGIGALIFVPILKALTNLPPYMGIILGLSVVWIFTDLIHQKQHYLKVPHILTKIDISSILFFLGILLSIAALETAGILKALSFWMEQHLHNYDLIAAVMGIISAIIDNVPLTAAMMGMYNLSLHPIDSKLWEMTAYCVGTGGSILIIGSAAGVVVMGMEKIKFTWYLKKISLPALAGYLAGVIALLVIYR